MDSREDLSETVANQLNQLRERAKASLHQQRAEDLSPAPVSLDVLKEEWHLHQRALELQAHDLLLAVTQAERANARSAQLFEGCPVALMTVNADTLILEASSRAAVLLGVERRNLIRNSLLLFVAEHDRARVLSHCRTVSHRLSQPLFCEVTVTLPNGGTRLALLESVPRLLASAAETPCCLMALTDLASNRQVEALMQKTLRNFHEACQAAKVSTWEWDLVADRVSWSEGTEAIFGLAPGTFRGSYAEYLAAIDSRDRDKVLAAIQAAIETSAPYQLEHRIRWPNGEVHWLACHGGVSRNQAGQAIRMLGTVVDVTERKFAEQRWQQSEAQFTDFMTYTPAIVMMRDEAGRYTFANPKFEQLFDLPPQGWLGKTNHELFVQDMAQSLDEKAGTVFSTNQPMESLVQVRKPDGTELRWWLTMFPMSNGNGGRFIGTVGVDLSPLKHAEDTVAQQREALDQSRKELQATQAKVTHAQEEERHRLARELHDNHTQQLTALIFETQLLLRANPDWSGLHSVVDHLKQLMDELRSLSHELYSPMLERLGLVRAVETHVSECRARTGLPVTFQASAVPAVPREHTLCLFRVLQEALQNVQKYAHAKEVKVGLHADERGITLTVSDNGVGFDVERMSAVGGGLGLLGMRDRVQNLNGELTIQSQQGAGTVVTAWVPFS